MIKLQPTQHQKLIARKLSSEIDSKNKSFTQYWDDERKNSIVIFSSTNTPKIGVDTYSTVGLSKYPLHKDNKEIKVRIEIIGAISQGFPKFSNMIATAAFCVINNKWFCAPGVIFPDVVSMYSESDSLTDLYFCPPFLWDERLEGLTADNNPVAWLLAVPISKAETAFASLYGPAELEKLFESANLDIYDLHRSSIV